MLLILLLMPVVIPVDILNEDERFSSTIDMQETQLRYSYILLQLTWPDFPNLWCKHPCTSLEKSHG
jgi:hypothetical protein